MGSVGAELPFFSSIRDNLKGEGWVRRTKSSIARVGRGPPSVPNLSKESSGKVDSRNRKMHGDVRHVKSSSPNKHSRNRAAEGPSKPGSVVMLTRGNGLAPFGENR